jgi:hypothetical protein
MKGYASPPLDKYGRLDKIQIAILVKLPCYHVKI